MTFGTYVRSIREAAGLSQRDCADRLGISVPYLWRVESGERPPFPPARWPSLVALGADLEQLRALTVAWATAKVHARVTATLPTSGNDGMLTS